MGVQCEHGCYKTHTLQGSPRYIRPWFNEYVVAKCLNTSSSGVNDGLDNTELNMEFGVLSNGYDDTRAPPWMLPDRTNWIFDNHSFTASVSG